MRGVTLRVVESGFASLPGSEEERRARLDENASGSGSLGDETRWSILMRLGLREASASALSAEYPISRQATLKHLEVLRAVGLVEAHRHGREVRYRALGSQLSDVGRVLGRVAGARDARLARIKAKAEGA